MPIDRCPITGDPAGKSVFQLNGVPVLCNQLWPDAEAACGAPKADIDLVFCESSGLLWNRAFDPQRMAYAPGYENALHFSPNFQAFADELARELVTRHGLTGKAIVEIGCGDGFMLDLMVRNGVHQATGYDPSMAGIETPFTKRKGIRIVPEYFHAGQLESGFDAILCRHVLEHLDEPMAFLKELRSAIGKCSATLYLEVPNADWMLETVSMWDVIYEHVTYWTAPAMECALRRSGFEPLSIRAGYGGQFLMAEARPSVADPDWLPEELPHRSSVARHFGAAADSSLKEWNDRLSTLPGRAVIWGAGSKGITFANALDSSAQDKLAALVDLNPRKHGKFIPGIGLPVVDSGQLQDLAPTLILVSNPLYLGEITRSVRDMGLNPEFRIIAD